MNFQLQCHSPGTPITITTPRRVYCRSQSGTRWRYNLVSAKLTWRDCSPNAAPKFVNVLQLHLGPLLIHASTIPEMSKLSVDRIKTCGMLIEVQAHPYFPTPETKWSVFLVFNLKPIIQIALFFCELKWTIQCWHQVKAQSLLIKVSADIIFIKFHIRQLDHVRDDGAATFFGNGTPIHRAVVELKVLMYFHPGESGALMTVATSYKGVKSF